MATSTDDVNFEHPQYLTHKAQVKLCNQIYNGIDTAKALIYQSPNEHVTDYYNRVENTPLNNYVERVVTTMAGQIFRKELLFEDIPDRIKADLEEIAPETHINQFAKDLTALGILEGKSYILIDRPIIGGDPFFSTVRRSQLINWKKDEEGNFTFAVIYELYEEPDGKFAIETKERYRVLLEDGNVEIYTQTNGESTWNIETIVTDYDSPQLYELDVGQVPPLYDIAKMNSNYLNAFSKKDQYLETAGSPIPFGKGLGIEGDNDIESDDPSPTVVLGVNSMILTDNTEANLEWVEMSGGSIEALQDDLERKEKAMAERALVVVSESEKTKTATQTNAENSESSSRLSDIAEDCETVINTAYQAYCLMKYKQEGVGGIRVNRDFNAATLDTNLLTGLTALQTSGNLSTQTLLESLVKHEIIELNDIEEELARIDEEGMKLEEDNEANIGAGESDIEVSTAE